MAFQLNLFSLPLTIAGAGMVALAIIVWLRYRSKPEGAAVTLLMLAVAQWSLCYALEIGSVDLWAKLFWAKTEYLGIVALPIA